MEDFRLLDGVYEYDSLNTSHPGYLFKMSARDAARFGQLFLQNGMWNEKQIIPKSWIKQSTSSHVATTTPGVSYGYLWWIAGDIRGTRMYFASGTNGQRICVIPDKDVVLAINVDTYRGRSIRGEDSLIAGMVFGARTENALLNPQFVPLNECTAVQSIRLNKQERQRYVGQYIVGDTVLTVSDTAEGLIVVGPHYSYKFSLLPIERDTFFIEDLNMELTFGTDGNGRPANPRIKNPTDGYRHLR
jgi:CubicO group peptidase (beta-lactamase class C family)